MHNASFQDGAPALRFMPSNIQWVAANPTNDAKLEMDCVQINAAPKGAAVSSQWRILYGFPPAMTDPAERDER